MAGNNLFPRLGLLSQFDTRQWNGIELYTRGALSFVMNTNTPATFEDILAYVSGRCSYQSFAENIETAVGGATTWTAGINSNDKVFIRNSSTAFSFICVSGRMFERMGFSVGTHNSVADGAGQIIVATTDWVRGDFVIQSETITLGIGYFVMSSQGRVQDIPTMLRSTSEGDLDEQSLYHLQKLDNDALGTNLNLSRWGITSKGHVFNWRHIFEDPIAWSSTSFRDRLGFDGVNDTVVSEGGGYTTTARYPLPGCIIPSRPYDACESISETFSNSSAMDDGTISTNYISTHYRWFVRCYLDGPADAINNTSIDDLHRHWQQRCKPYLSAGAPCTLYQEWGDSRRASERGNYGLLYSNEQEGYRGRMIGWMAIGSPAIHQITWPQNLRRRSPLEFTIQQDPTTIT